MHVSELFRSGVTKVRQPHWNMWAYMELHDAGGGLMGPWARLYDVSVNGMTVSAMFALDGDNWQAWVPPANYETRREMVYGGKE